MTVTFQTHVIEWENIPICTLFVYGSDIWIRVCDNIVNLDTGMVRNIHKFDEIKDVTPIHILPIDSVITLTQD